MSLDSLRHGRLHAPRDVAIIVGVRARLRSTTAGAAGGDTVEVAARGAMWSLPDTGWGRGRGAVPR